MERKIKDSGNRREFDTGAVRDMRAAAWNILFAIWTEKNKPEMQNIPMRDRP